MLSTEVVANSLIPTKEKECGGKLISVVNTRSHLSRLETEVTAAVQDWLVSKFSLETLYADKLRTEPKKENGTVSDAMLKEDS